MATKSDGVDRARVIEHLREQPGARPSDVARVFDVHPSTAEYHLRRLEREGRVIRVQVGRQLHHYAAGQGLCCTSREVHARLTPAGQRILEIGLERGIFPRQAIVGGAFTSSAVRWALDQLSEAGVVERLAWGVYQLVDESRSCVRSALAETSCRGCNDAGGHAEAGHDRRRATSRPSPSGRMDGSRSG